MYYVNQISNNKDIGGLIMNINKINLNTLSDSDDTSLFDQIKECASVTTSNGEHTIQCLTIIGEIEGHVISSSQNKTTKYEHIIPQLVAIEESAEIQGLLVILNTVGGDVEAGLAIAELIAGMKKPTVSLVLGGAHSIGIPLSVAAKKSFIVPSATMTVHPVRMNGMVLGVPQMLRHFEKIQDRIISFVTRNSKISKEKFSSLMMNVGEMVNDVGSILDGEKAVEVGLIDNIGSLSDATRMLYKMIDEQDD
jgi:ATP-dependent protease ClpP protease subunit